MEERLATVVSETSELALRLESWSKAGSCANLFRGHASRRRPAPVSNLANKKMGEHDLMEVASKWVQGEQVNWDTIYTSGKPRKIGLPTYPFARDRYWVADTLIPGTPLDSKGRLHPLISYNSSTLKQISFASSLPATGFYALDHKVNGQRILPGAAFLEMACISASIAGERKVHKITDIAWAHPLIFRNGCQTVQTLLEELGDTVAYTISSSGDEESQSILHCEGRLVFRNRSVPRSDADRRLAIQELKSQCARREPGAFYYSECRKYGFDYGPSFQAIQEIHASDTFALCKLKLPHHLKDDFGQFVLHPSMIDGALQAAACLVENLEPGKSYLPFALEEIEIINPLPQSCYAYAEYAEPGEQDLGELGKVNIQILNQSGDPLVKLNNLFLRPLEATQKSGRASGILASAAV